MEGGRPEQFPNLHKEIHISPSLPLSRGVRVPAPLLPVPVTDFPELGANDASHERPHSASAHKGLCNCPNPNVDVFWCPIQVYELLRQVTIPQHLSERVQSGRLGEPTELSPGVITCR